MSAYTINNSKTYVEKWERSLKLIVTKLDHKWETYVTVLEKRDHLATKIIFKLCILSETGHYEL